MRAEQKSLVDQFVAIDKLIEQNHMSDALEELKKAEKEAGDKWSYLGLYKRYARLGETESAERVLKKGIKDNSKSKELNAVYANFLINQNRLDEAEKYGKKLIDTEYASLYSEIILKKSLDISNTDNIQDFYNIYYNAYLTSKNPVWIRNCAVLDLKQGRYDRIPELVPGSFADVDDAFFWALALYDAGRFYEAIDILENAQTLRENYNGFGTFKVSQIEQTALLSDAYMAVSDINNAELARQKLIINIDNLGDKGSDKALLPVILTNSAIWAYNNDFNDECADLLFYIVNRWPDYVPALILYSDFAYNSTIEREENAEMIALREAGLATVEMEKYDNRRKIPVSDALYRVNAAFQRTNDPYLSIIQLDLKYKTDKSLTDKEKNRDLWNMLEDSLAKSDEYQSLLIQYALHSLVKTKQYDDAWDLFQTFVYSISEYNSEEKFWPQFISKVHEYDIGIVEFGAWFAASKLLKDEALALYEYCVYDGEFISPTASTSACMNLADLYEATGQRNKALDLYGRISGRESKKSLRSEIFYRVASIYSSMGDYKNALRSVEYACELYPENVRASLLKDSLRNREESY